jgi:hypothetical protein
MLRIIVVSFSFLNYEKITTIFKLKALFQTERRKTKKAYLKTQ